MAPNIQKIRLGAPDSQTLTIGAAATELGATSGGAELDYNPTILAIEIDQALMPVASYKTKEELTYATVMNQFQLSLVALAWSYATASVATISGTPSTDTLYFGNYGNVPFGVFDATILKQDGTGNHIRLHLNKVYSSKTIKLGFHRDKATTLDKITLQALADLTQPLGQQGGWLREEY
jgi:hypothetical protein